MADTDKQAAERTDQVVGVQGDDRKLKQGIERDSQGRVAVVSLDKRVGDPSSPEAVQVPNNTIPADHDTQLGLSGADDVVSADLAQLKANQVQIGDVTAESLEVSSKSHNPVSPAMERLQDARADLDAHNAGAEAVRAEGAVAEDAAEADAEAEREDVGE